jgi:hypothetical protein
LTLSYPRYSDETKKKDITVWGYRNVWFRFEPQRIILGRKGMDGKAQT